MSVSAPDSFAMLTDVEQETNERLDETTPMSDVAESAATEEPIAGEESSVNGESAPVASRNYPTFGDLGLPDDIVSALAKRGVTEPFPIQAATIPDALAGKDILGRGRTGSGKTLSFGLPLLTRLANGGRTDAKRPRGLILTPTRELAMQVSDALEPYGSVFGLSLKVVCGGTSMARQIYALERGVDILVATPGRLRDLIDRGSCTLDRVEIAVLDEADQMADMGFLPEVTEILDLIPSGGQRMLFSATLENEVDTLVRQYLADPVTHEVDPSAGVVTTMTHHILVVKPKDKAPVTAAIAARKGRTIIFVRTQMGADRVAEQLIEAGVRADALHGGMTQGARTRTLSDFKDGYVNVLVATDVAARGIHVDGIDLVLNVDPAGDHKDYLHRSGRTARAGQSGIVVTLALPHQRRSTFRLMEDARVKASRHVVAGAFDEDLARITGARSLTEVQAESASNAAKQVEREVEDLTLRLERLQRRGQELRAEADRLTARAARERGEPVPVFPADSAPAADSSSDPEAAASRVAGAKGASVIIPAQAGPVDERPETPRCEYRGHDGGGREGSGRDRDGGWRHNPGREGSGSRGAGDYDGAGFDRARGFDRREGRRERPFDRDRSFDRREDRRDDRGGRSFDRDRGSRLYSRRDDRPEHRGRSGRSVDRDRDRDRAPHSYGSRDDRGERSFDRSENRNHGHDRGGRGFERRDDRTGRSFDRREDRGRGRTGVGERKPRWKRNG